MDAIPNKAQHSPIVDVESVLKVATALQKVAELPSESNRDKLTATLTESRQKLLQLRERDAHEYSTLKAHADKLAEALQRVWHSDVKLPIALENLVIDTLKAYEADRA